MPTEQPSVVDDESDPRAPALTRTAHRLSAKPHRCIALVPATVGMRLHPVAVALGLELAALEHCNVAVVTPDASALSREGACDGDRGTLGRWVGLKTLLLAPSDHSRERGALDSVLSVLKYARQRCPRVVLDVSPLADRSEQLAMTRWADGVCIVARARMTKELELLRVQGDILEDRNLGVLLVEE